MSEQPPSGHVDKLASKQSVHQNKEHNSYFQNKNAKKFLKEIK